MTAAASRAAIMIMITAPPAEVDGMTGAGVAVDEGVEMRITLVEVGQGVEDGREVGVGVGWVGVGVYAV